MEAFVRHFLLVYFLLIGLYYAARGTALYRRTGISHFGYGERWSASWWRRWMFNGFRLAILLVVCLRVPFPGLDAALGSFQPMMQPQVLGAGVALLLISYTWVSYTHSYMNQQWRSGLARPSAGQLLTGGPFAHSRNPLFMGVMVGQLGLFLAMPGVFSLTCLVVGASVLVYQARAEEPVLKEDYGAPYVDYCRRVPRWLGPAGP